MRIVLLALTVATTAAAGYYASDRGAGDPLTLFLGAAALSAFVLSFLVSGGSRRPDGLGPVEGERPHIQARAGIIRADALELSARHEATLAGRDAAAVYLVRTGRNKIAVIKVLRQYLDLGLKEAKDLADAASEGQRTELARDVPVATAREFGRELERAGATVEFE